MLHPRAVYIAILLHPKLPLQQQPACLVSIRPLHPIVGQFPVFLCIASHLHQMVGQFACPVKSSKGCGSRALLVYKMCWLVLMLNMN